MSGRIAKARLMAYDVLWAIAKQGAYAHVILHEVLDREHPTPNDAALASEIVYGVLTWQRLLDHEIALHSKVAVQKMDFQVLVILRMSLYQLRFFSRVPSYAILSDAVELTKQVAFRASGFVNGVLRSATRTPHKESAAKEGDCTQLAQKQRGVYLSFPDWLVDHFTRQFCDETACEIMEALNQKVARTARVNTTRYTPSEVIQALQEEGVLAQRSPVSPYGIRLPAKVNPTALAAYKEGMYTLQGESSMLVAPLFGDMRGKRVLDACAAPGGKALHIAELAHDQAEVVAVDLHPHRVQTILQQAKRLHLSSIQAFASDARAIAISGSFDAILLDAPCSGLGTIARKPDIKWRVLPSDIEQLAELQSQLLDALAQRVQIGGLLIYTTCTLSARENELQIREFLRRHSNFQLEPLHFELVSDTLCQIMQAKPLEAGMAYLLPQELGTDGFFFAKMRRVD
ncbi:16S rRNA (cytosine(967)-C(5))-methyltransferase [Sulfoacidibacillus thermotolerans]|uniref:16S rRNA (cytosine(967)-C(5))-methyltransferase n=2 Tax=Sulfoacidibacillus thermotolerans TaxID=1765684 RepID=A0A2U3D7R6_SULT2|nr:16S rRNA (cytosine(967)-C(5))-methyltransferase [Sulfoacidibacillus thermotolerans]